MCLYKYFTTSCDTVCKAYGKPSEKKQAIELDIMGEMLYKNGANYRVLEHNPFYFTCGYMYRDSNGMDYVRVHTYSTVKDVLIYNITPEVIPVLGENGLPSGKHRMVLTVAYKDGKLEIPYHELDDVWKPLFEYYIRVWGYPVR